MDSATFLGNVIEVECGESGIFIGKVDNIDTKLQQISLVDGKKLHFSNSSKFFNSQLDRCSQNQVA